MTEPALPVKRDGQGAERHGPKPNFNHRGTENTEKRFASRTSWEYLKDVSPFPSHRPFLRYWLPAAIWAALIFCGSAVPSTAFPDAIRSELFWDKLGHEIEYALLGALLFRALVRGHCWPAGSAVALTVLISSAYGWSDEFHQRFVPGRTFDWQDVLMDGIGGIIGASMAAVFFVWRRKTTRRPAPIAPGPAQ